MKIWSLFRNPNYRELHRDYNKNPLSKYLSGREDIWRSLYFTERELYFKYKHRISQAEAMADALGVAYRVLKK